MAKRSPEAASPLLYDESLPPDSKKITKSALQSPLDQLDVQTIETATQLFCDQWKSHFIVEIMTTTLYGEDALENDPKVLSDFGDGQLIKTIHVEQPESVALNMQDFLRNLSSSTCDQWKYVFDDLEEKVPFKALDRFDPVFVALFGTIVAETFVAFCPDWQLIQVTSTEQMEKMIADDNLNQIVFLDQDGNLEFFNYTLDIQFELKCEIYCNNKIIVC
jgi:hypothetical protein